VSIDASRISPAVPDRVFITGANGFIGRALAQRLRELGADVTGVDLHPDPDRGVRAGSTTDPEAWADALAGADAIIHTAAIVSNAARLDEAWTVNVLGTRRVIEAAIAAGVPRMVHLSSIMAFGFDYPDGVDETHPIRVCGHSYPDTRVNSEAVVLTAHAAGEIDATIVRPGDVFGPGSVWVREPIARARARQVVLPAGGNGLLSLIHVDNLVDGILLALANPAASGQVFTLTDGYTVTCRDYFGRLAGLVGAPVISLPTSVATPLTRATGAALRRMGRPNELSAATMLMLARTGGYSNAKARAVLGFEPRIGYDEGMDLVERWTRAEGLI
jgi:nucleoside-diphosphate-sugar epimerase